MRNGYAADTKIDHGQNQSEHRWDAASARTIEETNPQPKTWIIGSPSQSQSYSGKERAIAVPPQIRSNSAREAPSAQELGFAGLRFIVVARNR